MQNRQYNSALTTCCDIILGECSTAQRRKSGDIEIWNYVYNIQNTKVCWQYVVRYYWERVQRRKSGDIEIRCIISISAVGMYCLAIEKLRSLKNQWTPNKCETISSSSDENDQFICLFVSHVFTASGIIGSLDKERKQPWCAMLTFCLACVCQPVDNPRDVCYGIMIHE